MPSEAGQPLKRTTLEQYYDSNARYRPTRHHHGHRYRSRHGRSTIGTELRRPSLPTPEVAKPYLEPFDWKDQPPVRWTDVDVSTVLKPNDFVNFPPDPAPFRLPADPPIVRDYSPPDWERRRIFYTFALMIAAILGTGMVSELRKARTCHKLYPSLLAEVRDQPYWMPSSVWKLRNALRKLT